jgi:hypothetical protein
MNMTKELIPVPRRLLEELLSYLDREAEPMVSVPGNGEWTESMVQKLKLELERYPGAVAVVNEAARNAGKLVGLTEIAQTARIQKQQISNELSAMSKATRRLFGDKKWPFQAVDTAEGMHYLMQPEIAEWWQTA